MKKIEIDDIIKQQFEYYQNMCSLLSDFKDSHFDPPGDIEKIEQWEKDNGTNLPHQYKSWLLLSAGSNILDGFIELSWPEIGTLDERNDIIIIASIIGDGETVYISRTDRKVYSIFEGEIKEYNDFDDFLTIKSLYIETLAKEYLGDDWGDIYDKQFGSE
ncbi:hypothetical protein [Ruminococcus sp.]|uniref:hypothetical protein n=1 Tax=Ruminococcus sp. TaxID=41978 RepID=UPI0025DE8970|nr:hypothetical protein [Ruminococcus sp.]